MEEIITLKKRLIHTAKIANEEKSGKRIKMPGAAKFTSTTSTHNPLIGQMMAGQSPGGRSSS